MSNAGGQDFLKEILERNRYLVLATTNGTEPWIAPLEYMLDDDLNFYFFSTEDSRHVRDIRGNDRVAVTVFDENQPEYGPDLSTRLNGVQMEATVREVPPEEYGADITAAIEALEPPMPPYAVFQIRPHRFYLPRIEDGVNVRTEIEGPETT